MQDKKYGTLICIAGGGMPQIENAIGVLKALRSKGIVADELMGTSAGAIVSGLYASFHQNIYQLESVVRNSEPKDWFVIKVWQAIKSIFGFSNYVADNTGLKEFLEKNINEASFDTVKVAMTDMGHKYGYGYVQGSKLVKGTPEHILASMSFQHVFPPVVLGDGHMYADGGVLNNCPIPKYLDLQKYEHIYIILSANSHLFPQVSRWSFLNKLLNLVDNAMTGEAAQLDELHLEEAPNITVFRPSEWVDSASFLGWSYNFEQIDSSYEYALRELEKGNKNEQESH